MCRPRRDAKQFDWLKSGYSIEWDPEGPCAPSVRPNQKTAYDHADFLTEKLGNLVRSAAARSRNVLKWLTPSVSLPNRIPTNSG